MAGNRRVMAALKSIAKTYRHTSGQAITDETLIKSFLSSPTYKDLLKRNIGFNDKNAAVLAEGLIPFAVPQYNRYKYNQSVLPQGHVRASYSLPSKFNNFATIGQASHVSVKPQTRLNQYEMEMIESVIANNPFVTRQAQKAGLIKLSNGRILVNENATRTNVNAFAGQLANLYYIGAKGPHSKQSNLSPQSIAKKTNKLVTHSTAAMQE